MKKVFFILFLFPLFSYSQKDTIVHKWDKKINLGSNFYKGNSNKFDFLTTYNFSHVDSAKEIALDGRYYSAESKNKRTNDELSMDCRMDFKPFERISPFSAIILSRNPFRNTEGRISVLGGMKYIVSSNKKHKYSISSAFVYEYTLFSDTTVLGENQGKRLRLSIRPKFKQTIYKNISLVHQTFFKFSVSYVEDYTIESYTGISCKLNDLISISLNQRYVYERFPIQTVKNSNIKPYDFSLIWTIGFDF